MVSTRMSRFSLLILFFCIACAIRPNSLWSLFIIFKKRWMCICIRSFAHRQLLPAFLPFFFFAWAKWMWFNNKILMMMPCRTYLSIKNTQFDCYWLLPANSVVFFFVSKFDTFASWCRRRYNSYRSVWFTEFFSQQIYCVCFVFIADQHQHENYRCLSSTCQPLWSVARLHNAMFSVRVYHTYGSATSRTKCQLNFYSILKLGLVAFSFVTWCAHKESTQHFNLFIGFSFWLEIQRTLRIKLFWFLLFLWSFDVRTLTHTFD